MQNLRSIAVVHSSKLLINLHHIQEIRLLATDIIKRRPVYAPKIRGWSFAIKHYDPELPFA